MRRTVNSNITDLPLRNWIGMFYKLLDVCISKIMNLQRGNLIGQTVVGIVEICLSTLEDHHAVYTRCIGRMHSLATTSGPTHKVGVV